MRQLSYFLFGLALLGLMQVPLWGQATMDDFKGKEAPKVKILVPPPGFGPPPAPCLKYLDGRKLVFIADGAGENTAVADNLSDLNGELCLKLHIQVLNWCRQDHKSHDFVDQPSQLKAAVRLAGWTRMIRRDCPCCEIYFIGQDAGARVILAAAEMLPERTIDRIITIAPGVSSTYDLRFALRATRSGLDNFWSSEDDFLERVVENRGTSEGGRGFAAGRVGFRPPSYCDPRALEVYRMVRQHRWKDDMCGNGGHHAWTIKHNMKKCLIPIFFQPQIACAVVPLAPPPILKMKDIKE